MTVDQLLAEVSSHELSEWRAYFNVEEEERQKRQREAKAAEGAAFRARHPRRKR